MNNTTSWTDLDLSSLRRVGTEFHGACPVTSTGTDGFWINPGKRLIGCRHCSTNGGGLDAGQFTAHLDALGGAESAPPALTTAEWTDVITGDTVVQTRTGQTDPKYLWPHRTKVANLVYLARYEQEADRPIVWCEGAKAATAAARKLPADYDVLAFVSASTIPSAAALKTLATGRACVIWPDDNLPGAKVAQRLSVALTRNATSVRTLDPAQLGITGGRGEDAHEWHPTSDPAAEFEAACDTVAEEDDTPLTVGLTEWLTTMRQPPDVELAPDAPGLLYRRRIGVVHSNRGVGKSTYGAGSATSASRGGKVLVICCDDPASWASRLESFGAEHVVIGTMEALAPEGQLERAAHDCDAVIIDSWRRWLRAADRKQGGRSNSANDESVVGPVIDRLVDLAHSPRGPAVTMLANEAKSAEATTARGSFALEDAVDFVRRISKEGDVTTISTADKVRVGIPTGPWRMRLVEPGGFEPSTGGGGSSLGGDPFQPFGRLDEEITGYLMAHPHSTARAVTRHVRHRFAVVAARLSAIAECGPDKTWRARPEAVPREGDAPGHTVSQSASHPHSHCPDTPGHTVSQGASHSTPPIGKHPDTPATDTRAGGTLFAGNDAKGVDAAKHESSCPACFGDGTDALGRPCDRRQVVHSRAAFTLGAPTFSAKLTVIPAMADSTHSASP